VGEVDRARTIYVHASSLSDPRSDPAFWNGWNDFEVRAFTTPARRCCSSSPLRRSVRTGGPFLVLPCSLQMPTADGLWEAADARGPSSQHFARKAQLVKLCSQKPLQVKFGNEDTFREMLRIKRSVAASFSQLHFNTAIIDSATGPSSSGATKLS